MQAISSALSLSANRQYQPANKKRQAVQSETPLKREADLSKKRNAGVMCSRRSQSNQYITSETPAVAERETNVFMGTDRKFRNRDPRVQSFPGRVANALSTRVKENVEQASQRRRSKHKQDAVQPSGGTNFSPVVVPRHHKAQPRP